MPVMVTISICAPILSKEDEYNIIISVVSCRSYAGAVDKSGMRLTTLPSLAACILSLASSGESAHRAGGSRFPIAQ